jgi:hypothetical protein
MALSGNVHHLFDRRHNIFFAAEKTNPRQTPTATQQGSFLEQESIHYVYTGIV